MAEHSYGPIAELRHAIKSPYALVVGALYGGAAPLLNFFTVHCAKLAEFNGETIHARSSPLWLLVAGSFALSSKSVYRSAKNTFEDWVSAVGMVAMLESALILGPHWAIKVSALVLLVILNASAYGSNLALRDQRDTAQDAKRVVALPVPEQAAAAFPASLPIAHSALALPVGIAPALPLSPEPEPAEVLPTPSSSAADSNYDRAVELARDYPSITIEELRLALRVRQPTARALMAQLARDGVVPQINPSNRRRRPVLLAESA